MKRWMGPLFCVLFLCPWIIGAAECNAFLGTADRTGDDALTFVAQQYIDAADYDNAIATIVQMTTTRRNSRAGRVLEATARAGKCGLNFIDLATSISNGLSGSTMFELLLTYMRSVTDYSQCTTAETLMTGITTSEKTSDDYIFLAFLSFAKIGGALAASNMDLTNDGAVDGGKNPCLATDIANADINEIGASFNIGMQALSSSGVSVASTVSAAYTTLCADAALTTFCTKTSSSSFSSAERLLIRTLINANEVGLDVCGGAATPIPNACTCAVDQG